MEGLRQQGISALSQLRFIPAPDEHELITVNRSEAPARVFLPLHDILERLQEQSHPPPAIRLVKLHIRYPHLLKALDPPLLTKGIQGYYQQHETKSQTGNRQSHYLFGSYYYCLIWTYSPHTKTTNAVMLVRPEDHLGRVDYDQWLSVLAMQTPLAHHPLCLFLATIMQTWHVATTGSTGAQALINDIEWETGFYPWVSASTPRYLVRGHIRREPEDEFASSHDPMSEGRRLIPSNSSPSNMTLDELSIASRNIGTVLVMLEDHTRQLSQLQLAIEAFTSIKHSTTSEEEEESVAQALRLITQRIESYNKRLPYLRERGKNQLTVIFNLMTRADTQASISLAKSAKKDSSAMKVIAVMTMAFLPATFLAALFAVPSLKWDDEEKVMQDNFWVFWAFALPAAGLVFGLWFLMTPGEESDVNLMTEWFSRLRGMRSTSNMGSSAAGGGQADGTSGDSARATGTAIHSEATIRRLQNFLLNRGGNLGDMDLGRPIDLSEMPRTADRNHGHPANVHFPWY